MYFTHLENDGMNIFVGNLNFRTTEDELRNTFSQYGDVDSARIVLDRETQRSRGFGFVEMPDDNEAQEAIRMLNGSQLGDRELKVNEARPRENRPRRY